MVFSISIIVVFYINNRLKITKTKSAKNLSNFYFFFCIYFDSWDSYSNYKTCGGKDQIILISKMFLVLNILPWDQIFILSSDTLLQYLSFALFWLYSSKIKIFFFFLASIVAFSRVIVSAHFFTDIVAGAILALILFKF